MKQTMLIAAAFAAFTSVGANAASYDLGTINLGLNNFVSDNFSVSGAFSDTITFNLAQAATLVASVNDNPIGAVVDINGMTAKLGSSDLLNEQSQTSGDYLTGYWQLSAGSHTLTVGGSNTGSLGGVYTVTVGAVPEPETWAMLLAGLGLVGMQLRRKLKSADKVSLN